MAKYKIKVVGLLLLNNKMAEFGDLVDEANFSTPAADLVKGGYVSVATKADFDKIKEAEKSAKSEADKKAKEAKELLDEEEKSLTEQKKKDDEAEAQRLKDEEDAAKALLLKK